jgi:hypothetical protein
MTRMIETVFLALILSSAVIAQMPEPLVIAPPSAVNMQLEGTDVLQDGACVTYYKTRDRGEGQDRASRGDVVWRIVDGQAVVVLEPGRSATDGNGTLGIENGMGYLYVVGKNNLLLRYPIAEWVSLNGAQPCTP